MNVVLFDGGLEVWKVVGGDVESGLFKVVVGNFELFFCDDILVDVLWVE